MKKILLFMAALVLGLSSCSKDERDDIIPNVNSYTNTVTIGENSYAINGIDVDIVDNLDGYNEPVFRINGAAERTVETVSDEVSETVKKQIAGFALVIPVSSFDKAINLLGKGNLGFVGFGKSSVTETHVGPITDKSTTNVYFSTIEKTIFGQRTSYSENGVTKGIDTPKIVKYYVSVPSAYDKLILIHVVYEDALKNKYILSYKGKYKE